MISTTNSRLRRLSPSVAIGTEPEFLTGAPRLRATPAPAYLRQLTL